ncbi:hypothetical protein SEVIR_5G012550v4 [Setaria viridis]|uniref:Secreted protein n=1 Tax=Setaria viridis TaxID=4556 RepID=A0A4U6U8I2_SETVI|nr:hypothetical protein SEVIR_5G012550v2 [Setaria viridis]TKW12071.1 hypothetical protein SEVIR_5G012550v2 [Setaria viridis]TKW12072.1 hypothetical protein SEVIR_5G012550v2 [Setaria viridis]
MCNRSTLFVRLSPAAAVCRVCGARSGCLCLLPVLLAACCPDRCRDTRTHMSCEAVTRVRSRLPPPAPAAALSHGPSWIDRAQSKCQVTHRSRTPISMGKSATFQEKRKG